MLTLITGRKNSGKSRAAYEILGRAVGMGETPLLLVPKQFTFDSDRGILSLLGPRAASEIEVLSFSRLCHVAVKTYGGITQPVAGSGMRLIYMSLALDALRDRLDFFAEHRNSMALVTKLLEEIDNMKTCAVTAENLESAAEKTGDKRLKGKLKETALIYRTYSAIVAQSHFDDADMLDKVCDILKGTDFFTGRTVVIDGFRQFTQPEYRLIELMLTKAKNVYITLCSDDVSSVGAAGPFAGVNATARRLRRLCGKNSIAVGEEIRCRRSREGFSAEMLCLEENLFRPDFEIFAEETDKVTVIRAENPAGECDTAARLIKAMIRRGEYRCRDIAVVYRSDEKYETGIKSAMKKYALPVFEDRRQPIGNQPLIQLVRSLLTVCSEGFDSDYIFRLLKTGLLPFETDEIARLENYVFIWDIKGNQWLSQWNGNPEGYGSAMGDKEKTALAAINETRKKIMEPLEEIRGLLRDASGKKAIGELYYFLRRRGVDSKLKDYAVSLENAGLAELALEQEQVWDLLMEIFDEMAEALGESPVKAGRLLEFFDLVVSEKSLGKLPDGYDEVFVCSADRIPTKNAKVVFILGMNAGVFPMQCKQGGVFPQSERKRLRLMGVELGEDIKEITLSERFLLYSALAAAEERLFVSLSMAGNTGEKLSESEGAEAVEKLFPRCRKILAAGESAEELIESESAAFELMARHWHDRRDEYFTLREYFRGREDYQDRMAAIERAADSGDFAFESQELPLALFGRDMYFSASQLEIYSKCPFMYFCRYGLRAKIRKPAKLDAAMGGNIVHHVLEKILSEHRGKDFLSMSEEEIDREIRQQLEEYMRQYMVGEDFTERFRYLYGRMQKILRHLFDRLAEELRDSDFEPCAFELNIARDGEVRPFTLTLEQGSVQLMGKIDRVDSMDYQGKRYIRVVDYKTGEKKFTLSDVFNGLNLQMLLYLLSIWREGTGYYEDIVPAGVLYFPARLSAVAGKRDGDSELSRLRQLSRGKMNGMLVGDSEIIEKMDKSRRGLFLPVDYDKKTGKMKGDFISVAQFKRLGSVMDGIIRDMGNSLHRGLVPARPIFGKDHSDTCAYCDYGDVCLKDTPSVRPAPKLSHEQCLEKLAGGEYDEQKLD